MHEIFGYDVDSSLTFDAHIDLLVDKTSKKVALLRKLNECLDRKTVLTLYKTLVLPHFDFCDTVYMSTSVQNLSKLQLIQNTACRTILMAPGETPIVELHSHCNSLLLTDRRNVHMALECHKNIYFENQASLGHFYVPVVRVTGAHTRLLNNMHMIVPRVKTAAGMKAYSVRGSKFWNSLKMEIRLLESFNLLKSRISVSAKDMFENHPT